MEPILKAAEVEKQLAEEHDLELINRQTLRELSAGDVFTFRLAACDNQVDREFERFSDKALEQLAPMFVGKSVLMDHEWKAGKQTARVYDAGVEAAGEVRRLILRCYLPRTEGNFKIIDAIETGILRECSVGCQVERAVCNICGADQSKTCCAHVAGKEYDGKTCVMELDEARDAYEVSLVAVPAQRGAGVVKTKRYGGEPAGGDNPHPAAPGAPLPKEPLTPAGGPGEPEPRARDEPKTIQEKLAKMYQTERKE